MKTYIGLIDGKIYDICSDLINKRGNLIKDENYIIQEVGGGDYFIGDTWDFDNNTSLKDSPQRTSTIPPLPKSDIEKRLDALEARMTIEENK